MDVLISVVIPVYNVEKFLPKCINCVLKQTYKNLQIILVDDGSTDGCPQLCDRFEQQDNRIEVIHKKNGGLSDARNVGIQHAKGSYLALIDSDDCVSLDYIEYLYNLLSSTDSDLSICQLKKIDENDVCYEDNINHINKNYYIDTTYSAMRYLVKEHLIGVEACGKLYKTILFQNIKYPYGRYHEDVFTTYLIIDKCHKVSIGKEKKYYYRQRRNSIMNQSFSTKHLDAVIGNIKRCNFINKKYPDLLDFAKADVIYAANSCCLRIASSNVSLDSCIEHIKFLQKQYRIYTGSYLRDKRNTLAKIFSVLAYINLYALIKVCKKIYSLKNKIR